MKRPPKQVCSRNSLKSAGGIGGGEKTGASRRQTLSTCPMEPSRQRAREALVSRSGRPGSAPASRRSSVSTKAAKGAPTGAFFRFSRGGSRKRNTFLPKMEVSMRRVALTLVVVLALVVTAAGSAGVRLVSKTSSVGAGATASLTVSVTPARACTISVYYTTVVSRAKGLSRKSPKAGRVTWTWKVGNSTKPGRHRIVVSCGSAGTLKTSFVTK